MKRRTAGRYMDCTWRSWGTTSTGSPEAEKTRRSEGQKPRTRGWARILCCSPIALWCLGVLKPSTRWRSASRGEDVTIFGIVPGILDHRPNCMAQSRSEGLVCSSSALLSRLAMEYCTSSCMPKRENTLKGMGRESGRDEKGRCHVD